jgi:hypothetical protein
MKSYDASIKEATDLKFVHEEGLACEKGLQYFDETIDVLSPLCNE